MVHILFICSLLNCDIKSGVVDRYLTGQMLRIPVMMRRKVNMRNFGISLASLLNLASLRMQLTEIAWQNFLGLRGSFLFPLSFCNAHHILFPVGVILWFLNLFMQH